ncbi:hypothetical protein HZC09_04020, partial [Candidatus Micrarchaeota archaeon]|nr:hypothetical protein [Candidatus Micrarchaeota archaeon]
MPRPQRKATAFEPKTGRQPAKRPLIEKGGELHEVGLTATKILNKWLRMNTEKLLKEISITTARNYRIRNTTGSDLVLAAYASPGINIDTASKVKGPHGSILKELARLEQSHSEIVAEARKKKNQETFNMLIGLAPDKDTRLSLT